MIDTQEESKLKFLHDEGLRLFGQASKTPITDPSYISKAFEADIVVQEYLAEKKRQSVNVFCLESWTACGGLFKLHKDAYKFENIIFELILDQYPELKQYCIPLREISGFSVKDLIPDKVDDNLWKRANRYAQKLSVKTFDDLQEDYDALQINKKKKSEASKITEAILTNDVITLFINSNEQITPEEGAILLVELNPHILDYEDLLRFKHHEDIQQQAQDFYGQINKAIKAEELPEWITLEEIFAWVQKQNIEISLNLKRFLPQQENGNSQGVGRPEKCSDKNFEMACLQASQENSNWNNLIQDDQANLLIKKNVNLSVPTIKQYLTKRKKQFTQLNKFIELEEYKSNSQWASWSLEEQVKFLDNSMKEHYNKVEQQKIDEKLKYTLLKESIKFYFSQRKPKK